MPPPFHALTREQFADLLAAFPFRRRVNEVHMHHTWQPNHSQYRGLASIEAMWRFHTVDNGWDDLAQHLTIAPDGTVWTGRNWNVRPASASGFNGNETVGPFMFETIGNFDQGRDRLEGEQRRSVIEVIARLQERFDLPLESLRFHNELTTQKSCPGTGVSRREVLDEVAALRPTLRGTTAAARSGTNPAAADAGAFGPEALATWDILSTLTAEPAGPAARSNFRNPNGGGAPAEEGELPEKEGSAGRSAAWNATDHHDCHASRAASAATAAASRVAAARGQLDDLLTADVLNALRPHVINLHQGRLSRSGKFANDAGHLDRIFKEHLPAAVEAAKSRSKKLNVVFYAHGGLTAEAGALWAAHEHIRWWRDNDVYPIYFVWETGLGETLAQLFDRIRRRFMAWWPWAGGGGQRALATRDLADWTSDPAVEALARTLQGPHVWGAMKYSARLAVEAGGGALLAAERVREFHAAHRGAVDLHAVGHSAGSIFHARFVPAVLGNPRPAGTSAGPTFRTMHFLAPAIRVDEFLDLLAPRLGKGVDHLAVFTMRQDVEAADTVTPLYRKSLLYLIHHALEADGQEPILGLEISLRGDPKLAKLFGLAGNRSKVGEVVWSDGKSDHAPAEPAPDRLRHASQADTHGGFNEDRWTMNSVARRILDDDEIVPLPPLTEVSDLFGGTLGQWHAEERGAGAAAFPAPAASPWADLGASAPAVLPTLFGNGADGGFRAPRPASSVTTASPGGGNGRRRALCVGINAYPLPRHRLNGCVADAETWRNLFTSLGFEPPVILRDAEATRAAILRELSVLVADCRPGDVVAFQFAGHGAQIPDVDRDEANGDTPGQDEAMCPVDFADGTFLVDDDLAAVFDQLPAGASATAFMDCCHSGTITRFAVGTPPVADAAVDTRARFLIPTPETVEAHRHFRRTTRATRTLGAAGRGTYDRAREVLFSACRSREVALESDGHGHFTTHATALLLAHGLAGLTNDAFHRRVRAAFGPNPGQNPELHCAPELRGRLLLQPPPPTTAPGTAATAPVAAPELAAAVAVGNPEDRAAAMAGLLDAMAKLLR